MLSEHYHDSVLFEHSSYHLGQLLFMGFDEDAKAYMNLLLTMLHGRQEKSFASYPAYPYLNEHELLEFSSADRFLFPVEILTWLTIRRRMGLYSGENLPPLLQLKINQSPVNKLDVHKKDDIVIQCEEKLQNDNRQVNLR